MSPSFPLGGNSVRSVRKPRAFSRRTGSARIERLGPAKRILAAAGEARRHQRCRTRIPTFAFVRPWSRRPSRPPRRQREDDRDCGHRWKRGLDRRRETRTFSPGRSDCRRGRRRRPITGSSMAGFLELEGPEIGSSPMLFEWPTACSWNTGMSSRGKATKAGSQSGLPMFGTTFPE
jgi:hypothetical protein